MAVQDRTVEQIREIKSSLRLLMNGAASTAMRSRGVNYKLNFGVTVPELARLAKDLPHTHELAQTLWKEDIRECRMLAAMLQPADSFSEELADFWLESIAYPDLAEVCCKYLFCHIAGASVLSFRWMASESEIARYCGFLTIAHMMRKGLEMGSSYVDELNDQIETALAGGSVLSAQGAMAARGVFESVYCSPETTEDNV